MLAAQPTSCRSPGKGTYAICGRLMSKNGKLPAFDCERFAEILFPLSAEETLQLRENIEGEGKVLDTLKLARIKTMPSKLFLCDGFNRKAIADELKIHYAAQIIDFDNPSDVIKWMDDNQAGRRNRSQGQRAMTVEKWRREIEKESAGTPRTAETEKPAGTPRTGSFNHASEETGVAKPDLIAASKVLDHGSAALQTAVETGAVSVRAAARIATTLPKREQAAAIKEGIDDDKVTADKDLIDETGEKLPKDLIETFKARRTFDAALELIRQVSAAINPLLGNAQSDEKPLPGGEYLARETQRINASIAQLRADLNFARPYAVCPYPHGKGKCAACGGLGYVGKQTFKAAPKGKE